MKLAEAVEGRRQMSIKVEWDNDEKTIIRWTFSDPWLWEDFRAAYERSHAMIASVAHTVHILADAREGSNIPAGNIMSSIRMLIRHYPSNLGIHVAVSQKLLIRVMGETVGRLLPKGVGKGIYAVETVEEAYVLFARETRKTRKVEIQ
jgi:hypothetical protein